MSEKQDYVDYVETQLTVYKNATELIQDGNGEITPSEINKSLGEYSRVQVGLIAEYKRLQAQQQKMQNEFTLWWDEKFVEKRRELNPTSSPASKWLSKYEVESEVRVANKTEYLQRKEALDDMEARVSFLKGLLDAWKRHGDIIVSLSHNMRSELRSLSLEDRSNKAVKRERRVREI